ncbi:MAG: DNA primase [Chlamydiae bacterium]|nr:DNA primase [Chlamydiota bacterium]
MALYTKESLDLLRERIDLREVLSSHIDLKRAGASYKALCPFHEEKTPSFVMQSGDTHYHCFGCGAHGDAIAFLMNHQKMTFVDAVDSLGERFGVVLKKEEGSGEPRGASRILLKEALELATRLYHTLLLHTKEGHVALEYLYRRGIDLDFIRAFRLGYAPSMPGTLLKLAKGEGITEEVLLSSGLISERRRDFFSERITFPVTDPFGAVIAFSARKIREETFGGKYINTPETPLFKKSHTLFGLSHSRSTIAKERKALIVEGQIDALRLIHNGINFTVAAQGTAFGDGHVKLLTDLGVSRVLLATDGDKAGKSAAVKIGHLFQKKGIDVSIVPIPKGSDPDSLIQRQGKEAFLALIDKAEEYLPFLVRYHSENLDPSVPAQKNELINVLSKQIRSWEEPVMIHESLRKIAQLTSVPESVVGVGATPQPAFLKRFGRVDKQEVDPDRILETDLLRWLILQGEERLGKIVELNVAPDLFRHPICKRIFECLSNEEGPSDLIALGSVLEKEDEQKLLSEIVQKKVNIDKAEEGLVEVIHRLLIRKWMEEREAIKAKIQSGTCSDEEVLRLAKAFDEIKKSQPTVVMP